MVQCDSLLSPMLLVEQALSENIVKVVHENDFVHQLTENKILSQFISDPSSLSEEIRRSAQFRKVVVDFLRSGPESVVSSQELLLGVS